MQGQLHLGELRQKSNTQDTQKGDMHLLCQNSLADTKVIDMLYNARHEYFWCTDIQPVYFGI